MKIETRTEGGVTLVTLDGDLDANSSPQLLKQINALLTAGATRVVIDMENVGFMDSMGLSVVLTGYKHAQLRNGSVSLAQVRPSVHKTFKLTRVDQVITIFTGVEEAVSALTPKAP